MGDYIVFWKKEVDWFSDNWEKPEVVVVWAENEREAIRQFLYEELNFWPSDLAAEKSFNYFLAYVFCDELNGVLSNFPDAEAKKIKEIGNRILADKRANSREEYLLLDDAEVTAKDFWDLLTYSSQKKFYFLSNFYDVMAMKSVRLSDYVERESKNNNSIISHPTKEDITIMNLLLKMIRQEKKDKYIFNEENLAKLDVDSPNAKQLLKYFYSREGGIKLQLASAEGTRAFYYDMVFERVFKEKEGEEKYNITVKPEKILLELADAEYDFEDGVNETATKILKQWFMGM